MGDVLLVVDNVSKRFGGVRALESVSFSVQSCEIVGVIGPNGAGKTTLFNVVTGGYRPDSGQVLFGGRKISGLRPHEIHRLGISRTFQNIRLFRSMTVFDNVLVAVGKGTPDRGRNLAHIDRCLEWLGLTSVRDKLAVTLPYGLQKRVEIARALASDPELVLLDEPAAGLSDSESRELLARIRELKANWGKTVVLIDHNMRFVMSVCDRVVVLHFGKKIADGKPDIVAQDSAVVEAYLGRGGAVSAEEGVASAQRS